jgi:SAM-dependent methyltransferase
MNIQSPLTGLSNITLLKTFAADKIIKDWKHAFDIDITLEFNDRQEIYLYVCDRTKLRFFVPFDLAGSEKLYEELQKFDWFYMPHKWEHQIALNHLSGCRDVLEVGSGLGSFVEDALKQGHNAQGLELNRAAVEVAKHKNLPVTSIDLEEFAQNHPLSQDAICSFQVLEHVSKPKDFIAACLQALRTGGKLIFCVPNADSFLQYQYNLLDMPPHHMTQWNISAFKSLEHIFPLKLEKAIAEPLANYHVLGYIQAHGDRLRRFSPLGKLVVNRYTIPLYTYFLKSGLRNILTGQSIYVQFRKLDESA